MSGSRCNACNIEFESETEQRAHYRSEWHRHNLKRKVAGVPGVSEALFNLRLEALAAEKKNQDTRLIYTCSICSKSCSTAKSHAQHLKSKLHQSRAADVLDSVAAVIRPAPVRVQEESEKLNSNAWKKSMAETDTDSSDEWEEVDGDVDIQSLTDGEDETASYQQNAEWDPSQCFICDARPDGTLEGCVAHMHKDHGFFIPDAEYLKDPHGLLNYLGLKVTQGFMCLYCDERGKRFQSVEAVRKHMIAKSHCKLRYGEGEDGAEEELEEFYDFSSSCDDQPVVGRDLMAIDREDDSPVSLSAGGFELILKSSGEHGEVTKILGSREFHRYYKQRPKPVESRSNAGAGAVRALVTRYRSMGLATRTSNHTFFRPKETRNLPAVRLEAMRTKLGLKNNVIRNLPKNCTH